MICKTVAIKSSVNLIDFFLRQWPALRGDICSESPPKVCEIDMAQGEDMSKGPGTEEIMFLSAFILEI